MNIEILITPFVSSLWLSNYLDRYARKTLIGKPNTNINTNLFLNVGFCSIYKTLFVYLCWVTKNIPFEIPYKHLATPRT